MSIGQRSELVYYAPENPDHQFVGCRNTGELGDGVVFNGFEPMFGHVGFIGRSSIIEAAGCLFNLTPDEVVAALRDGTPKQKQAIATRDDKIKKLDAELKALKQKLRDLADANTEHVAEEIR